MGGYKQTVETPITKSDKDKWIEWIETQLDTTNNAKFTNTGVNRVFLTDQDDIDIARFILKKFLATVNSL